MGEVGSSGHSIQSKTTDLAGLQSSGVSGLSSVLIKKTSGAASELQDDPGLPAHTADSKSSMCDCMNSMAR